MSDHTTHMLYARGYDQAQRGEFGSAATLYARCRRHSRRGRLRLTRAVDSRTLLDLSEIDGTCRVDARCYTGLHSVPIEQIRGSEGRSSDFDGQFRPLQDHCKGRWLRVARAREQDKVLPPVVLVQVGDIYFVRDGHHRISVARALGQLDIEAEVTVWQVSGSLPWETGLGQEARNPVGQGMQDAGRSRVLKRGWAAAWLRSLLPGRSQARGLPAASSSSAA